MERLRLPRLFAAAVIVGCCARVRPCLSTEMGPTPVTAVPCTLPGTAAGERCPTDPEGGADGGQTPTPEAVGRLRTGAELLPFPGTPTGAAETPGPQRSPSVPGAGRDGAAAPRLHAGSERPGGTSGGAPAPEEPSTAPATGHPPGTRPVGNAVSEGATTAPGTRSRSPSSTTVPNSAEGPGGAPRTLPGWSPTGAALVQSLGGSHGPSPPQLPLGEDAGAAVPSGDSSPGPPPSTAVATDSPAPGTAATSPSAGGLQRLLTPPGTPGGTPGLGGGRGFGSHPLPVIDASWQGPGAAPRPSVPPLGADGPVSSAAPGTGPASLPAAGAGPGLPVPTGTPGVTSPGAGGPLDPTPGLSGAPDTEGALGHGHVPPHQTRPPGLPLTPTAPGSAVQSRGLLPSTGPPPAPAAPSAAPVGSSVVPTTPLPSPGTRWGVLGLSPTVSTPPAPGLRLPHAGFGGDATERPQILGGDPVGVADAGPWAVTAPLSWAPGSLASPSAPGTAQTLPPSQPEASLGPTAAIGITTTAVTIATTATTTGPALLRDVGTTTPEPSAAVLQRDAGGVTHLPTVTPEPPQQPRHPPGTLGTHSGGPGSPAAAGDPDLVQPSSDPGGHPDADTPQAPPPVTGRAPRVFIVEDQRPLLRASVLRVPCELVLDTGFSPALQDPTSPQHRALLHSFNRTVTPLFMPLPGFLRLEVTRVREGSVVLEYEALFTAERVRVPGLRAMLSAALGSGSARPGLAMGTASILRHEALDPDPCTALFMCQPGFACVPGADGNATCTSLCHRDYCKNHGICTHPRGRGPLCQCPVGSDFWFMGLRCDHRVTQQSLLGMAAGVLLSILLLGAVIAAVAVRRFKVLLMEARAEQTRSSYRRFCRLDDVSARYWSRSWLPSASSLDNPAFSTSEELLHLQALDNGCCGCREDAGTAAKQRPAPGRASFHYEWDTSSGSMNDPMVDSGKASDISVSSWPMEPIQWTPFPLLHQLSRQRPHKARRPHSYCEGMELVNLERSWTA